jgi:hypothetical protein
LGLAHQLLFALLMLANLAYMIKFLIRYKEIRNRTRYLRYENSSV